MKIDRRFRIWEAAAPEDDGRPVLQCVSIERDSEYGTVAVAVDGWMVAVVPVELEQGEEPCLMSGAALRKAVGRIRYAIWPQKPASVVLQPVVLRNPYPSWHQLIPALPTELTYPGIAFQPEQFGRACNAIGITGEDIVILSHDARRPRDPMILRPEGPLDQLRPPFAVLMPWNSPQLEKLAGAAEAAKVKGERDV